MIDFTHSKNIRHCIEEGINSTVRNYETYLRSVMRLEGCALHGKNPPRPPRDLDTTVQCLRDD